MLENTADDFAPRPDYRPLTKFEQRGLKLGHGVWDIVFRRRRHPNDEVTRGKKGFVTASLHPRSLDFRDFVTGFRHSILMFASRMNFPHLARSLSMYLPNCSGLVHTVSMPNSPILSFTSWRTSTF